MDDDDLMDDDEDFVEALVKTNKLRVGLTRPPTWKGIPLAPLLLSFGAVACIYCITGNALHMLIGLPAYGILRLISAKNPRIFAQISAWFRTAALCRNRRFWGAVSFSPRSVTKWEKW